MGWASILKAGGKAAKWLGKGAKATVETTGKAVLHPQQTIKGAGAAVKTAAVGGGLGYIGWQKLTTDDSVVEIVSDALIGKENTEAISEKVHGAADSVRELKDSVSNMTDTVTSAMGNMDSKMNGVSSFISQVTSGEGGNMLGGFFSNLTKGNVSGMSIMGLVLSAFLLFGRFGWMGKIAGALLAMMTIGNNSSQRQAAALQPALAQGQTSGEARQNIDMQQQTEQIHRSRR